MGHRRYKSDVTDMITLRGVDKEDENEEGITTSAPKAVDIPNPQSGAEQRGFSLPSIDLEFDVTVNVDHGKIVLRTEER